MSTTYKISSFVDQSSLSGFQKRIMALCVCFGLAEGINALSIGFVIPALSQEYAVPVAAFAFVFVAALIGEIIANFTLAPLGDKYGRRTMIRLGIATFGIAAVASAFVGSVEALVICRFFAGTGIGIAVPSVFTLGSDYSPNRAKGSVISVLSMSISAGAFFIGLIAASFIPAFGGPAFLALGGIVPLIVMAASWWLLPESIDFLAARGEQEKARKILHRINAEKLRELGDDVVFVPEGREKGVRVAQLFQEGRSVPTVLLWMLSFVGLFNSYFIFSFLATILIVGGIAEPSAMMTVSIATLAGMIGTVLLGFMMDWTKLGVAAGAVGNAVAIIGFVSLIFVSPDANMATFMAIGAALGAGAIGANACSQVAAAQLYPAPVRATGLGWYSAMGRLGGLVAPSLIGALLAANIGATMLYGLAIIPLAIMACVLIFLSVKYGSMLKSSSKIGTEAVSAGRESAQTLS